MGCSEERAEGSTRRTTSCPDPTSTCSASRTLVGTPEAIAERLVSLHARCPLDELAFWARLPGVPHDMASAHLERLAERVMLAVRELGATP